MKALIIGLFILCGCGEVTPLPGYDPLDIQAMVVQVHPSKVCDCFLGEQCCNGSCYLMVDVMHCGGCGNVCPDTDGDGCAIPGCWEDLVEYTCFIVPDSSKCPEDSRCEMKDFTDGSRRGICEEISIP
jgi:hypothetical protein